MGSQKFLLTGATGFIGSEVLCHLLLKGVALENIVLLGRSKPKSFDSLLGRRFLENFKEDKAKKLFESLSFIESDFLNETKFLKSLETLATAHPEKFVVIHMAAQVKAPTKEKALQRRVNVGVTEDLCHWSEKNASHFIYVSSVVAFGMSKNPVLRSEVDFKNFSWLSSQMSYFQTKRYSHEQVLKSKVSAISVVCPAVVHGSLEEEKNSRGHLRAVKEGKLRFAPSGGINIVSLKYVAKNIVDLALNTNAKKAETYLLAGENVTLLEYLQRYQDLHGKIRNIKIWLLPKLLVLPFIGLFYVWKFLNFPSNTSIETAVASFGYLYFKSQKLSPDEKVKF